MLPGAGKGLVVDVGPNDRYSSDVSPPIVSDEVLLDRLTGVFRRHGYDGASLSVIAAATGLQRSSLYHRFPGGKGQMAAEVAGALGCHFSSQVLAPLEGDEPVEVRLVAVAEALLRFYEGGEAGCLLDVLTLGSPGSATTDALAQAARAWIAAFAGAARQAGFAPAEARRRAEDSIAAIEGGLVLARVTGDHKPFRRALERLGPTLTGDEAA